MTTRSPFFQIADAPSQVPAFTPVEERKGFRETGLKGLAGEVFTRDTLRNILQLAIPGFVQSVDVLSMPADETLLGGKKEEKEISPGQRGQGRLAQAGAQFLFGTEGITQQATAAAPTTPEQQAAEINELNEKLNAPAAIFQLAQSAKNHELPAEIQQQIDAAQELASKEVEQINLQIQQKMAQLQVGQQLYGALTEEAVEEGIIPPLDSAQGQALESALGTLEGTLQADDLRSGLTPDVLAAVGAITDAQFASADPEAALNLVLHKTDFEQGLIRDIENLVSQRQTTQENLVAVEEALRNEGTTDTFNLPIDVPTSQGMFNNVAGDFVVEAIAQEAQHLNPFQEDALAATIMGTADQPGLLQQAAIVGGFETLAPQITQIAAQFGLDETVLSDALRNGLDQGLEAAGLADQWREAPILEPGSPALAAGIQETVLGLGGSPEDANRLVNSSALHTLIQLASSGQVGAETGTDMHGLGGLGEETYAALGYEYESIKSDTEAQLTALIQYIYTRFGGDTRQALESFRDGDWGGVVR